MSQFEGVFPYIVSPVHEDGLSIQGDDVGEPLVPQAPLSTA